MQRDDQCVAIANVIAEPFDLISVNVGCTHFDRSGQVNNDRLLLSRCQDLVHRIANRYGEIHLRAGKALRAVLKHPLCLRARVGGLFNQPCTIHGDVANAVSIKTENVFPLHRRGTVIKVHDGSLDTLKRDKGFFNKVRSRLYQHLHSDVIGNTLLFDELPQKREVMA